MNHRQLGSEGPQISEIGLGTWAIGGTWTYGWGDQDDQESRRTIRRALSLGINWIDTAPVYGLGLAEKVVGEAIRDRRKDVFLATKCGLVWDANGRLDRNSRPESIRRECEASLDRMKLDYIDLYQIHWPDPRVPVEESWGMLQRLQEEGKVRYLGVSNFDVDQLTRCQATARVQSLQPPYSMIKRDIEGEILPWCQQNDVGVLVYSPLQSGLLSGRFTPDYLASLADDDWRKRHKNPYFRDPLFSKAIQFVEGMGPIARQYGRTTTQLAIAWVLSRPGVSSVIVGMRTAAQAEANVGGAGWAIDPSDSETIDTLYQDIFSS